jgi:hypothetical protein
MDPLSGGPEEHDAPGRASTGAGRPFADGPRGPLPSRVPGSGLVPRPAAPAVVVPPHGTAAPHGAARDPLATEAAAPSRPATRVTQVVAGDYLLTVNPVDGSEVVAAPAERIPKARRLTAGERAARSAAAARPAPAAGPARARLPLLERDEECERVVRLLTRGRSVRITGPAGVGRSALLSAVADRCAGLAPDGVIRLSGRRRAPVDVLQELYAAVHATDGYRPDRARLMKAVRGIGAVVVLDDVEFGGAALEEVLRAAGECAFLIAATPQVPAPLAGSHLEEVFLPGLSKAACTRLLARALERELTEDEEAWAADLWFASEGLPLRFVQAAALLRQGGRGTPAALGGTRSAGPAPLPPGPAGAPPAAGRTTGPAGSPERPPADGPVARPGSTLPSAAGSASRPGSTLPSLAESAAPAGLLAARLSRNAQEALRVAVALGGECVDHAHLPALVGVENADGALGELIACGLATPVAGHHRLAAGVLAQLTHARAGFAAGSSDRDYALAAAQHYAWWAAHPSVPATRVAAESDALIAAMAACRDGGRAEAAVKLARAAAPEFAAALDWGAWERTLRIGQEAARLAGAVGEEAYFHHELGVLALCDGNLDRARTELEASVGMRGVLGDRQGGLVGRRTLALVNDRSGRGAPQAPQAIGSAATTRALPAARSAAAGPAEAPVAVVRRPAHALPPGEKAEPVDVAVARGGPAHRKSPRGRRPAVIGSRRNLAAAGAGAVIAAVLGTVVTLGTASDHTPAGPGNATPGGAAARNDDNVPADQPSDTASVSGSPSASPSASAAASPSPSASTSHAAAPVPSADASSTHRAPHPTPQPSKTSAKPTPPPSTSSSPSAPGSASPSPSQTSTASSSNAPAPAPSTSTASATAPATASSAPGGTSPAPGTPTP